MSRSSTKPRRAAQPRQIADDHADLRRRAEALAAEYSAPLPGGDAGLIEAERRLKEIRQQTRSLYRDFFKIDAQTEKDIIIGIIDPVRYRLSDFIDQTRPAGLAGAAVKLRLLADEEIGMAAGENQDELASLRQVLEFVEREAGGGPDEATAKALNPDPLAAAVSEALALRLLSRYREARDAVQHYGGDASALPAAPSFAEIDERYTRLMRDQVLDIRPETASAELRCLDLVEAIIVDRLSPHDAPVMSDDADLSCALQMLHWVGSWRIGTAARSKASSTTPLGLSRI
jgi:hypothetical protein